MSLTINTKTKTKIIKINFLVKPHQLASIIQREPQRAIWWAEQEKKIGGRFSKDKPDYTQMMNYGKSQIDMFDKNEETIACFCGD